jgi:carbon storage regulator CsrA
MLVLTRKYQEKIRIGENITITVLRMKGKAVRLGIEAPSDVPVVRGELAFTNQTAGAGTEEVESPTDEFEVAESGKAGSGRTFGRNDGMVTAWATGSRPDGGSRGTAQQSAGKVGFGRVPRDKVADLLPRMVSGTAPLRTMIEQSRG